MNNKITSWLGCVAILTISLFFVVNVCLSSGQSPEASAADDAKTNENPLGEDAPPAPAVLGVPIDLQPQKDLSPLNEDLLPSKDLPPLNENLPAPTENLPAPSQNLLPPSKNLPPLNANLELPARNLLPVDEDLQTPGRELPPLNEDLSPRSKELRPPNVELPLLNEDPLPPIKGSPTFNSDLQPPSKDLLPPTKDGKQPDTKQPETKQPETKQPDSTPPSTPPSTSAFPSLAGLPSVAPSGGTGSAAASGAPSTNVSGGSAVASTGVGNLLANSNSALGVEVQQRSPLVGDPRIEGFHFGQVVTHADGAYWFPARIDLDTVVSKLDSNDISNILIIKGPYSVRYGPGFSFMDIESTPTPRSTSDSFEAHGSTTVNYHTNGEGWQGQQSFWGGNTDWGFRLSYNISAASDYASGDGTHLPTSYNNQFVNFAFGYDLTRDASIEMKYLHVQQNNVLFPGLLTDINNLTSDAFSTRFTAKNGTWFDRITVDAWVNSTTFNGDSSNPQTRAQIPQLDNIFPLNLASNNSSLSSFQPVRLDIATNGNALSYGLREITTWGDAKGFNVSLGADVRVFQSNYNEFDSFNYSTFTPPGASPSNTALPVNLGIPNSIQIDPGLLADATIPLGQNLVVKLGGRADYMTSQFLGFGPNVPQDTYVQLVGEPIDRTFFLFSGFITGEYKITEEWKLNVGYGYAERAPTLTELYAGGAFLGLIQNGFNSIYGSPTLRKEEIHQMSIGVNAKYEYVRVGGNAFYAFLPNYITYENLGAFAVNLPGLGTGTTPINRLQFVNTPLATMYGFEAYGEYDVLSWLTPFATLSFVEGWDQTNNSPLPGIAPLDSRAGLRFHDPAKTPKWGVEYYARMVATQDLFAAALGEQRTGGFVVHNVRAYWQPKENLRFLAGVENIGNLQYQEHLDLRTGDGVFQPGINFNFGVKVSY